MKLKIMSLVTAMVLLLSCGSTSKTSMSSYHAYDAPAIVKTNFTAQYPNATNVVWSRYDPAQVPIDWELTNWAVMDTSDYAVRFDTDHQTYHAWYDSQGNWVGSAYTVNDQTTLPAAVTSTLTSQYTGYTIESVQKEMWQDHLAYEIRIRNGDNRAKLLIAENGTILKQKPKG